ncbi:SIMPL domain-containing protein [Anaerotalea alkaliphila]|uniref:SIMPL domain-containing protein n=1 Tax=Anaerotalea alkaliphila TaxID=2662126 RepID=A0A7X5HVT2_9FIRM|nr:SIMPL domain-containing protein [Anaerotalea alkaliphila]NDL67539.1 SIMPL domain-containing protein [Anaerotalea alkaliphila]
MERLITVKGIGKISIKPDLIVITMELESTADEYEKTMALAANSIAVVQAAVQSVGFDKQDLKTTSFNIGTNYENYRDKEQNYKSRFCGYICEQGLKLEFEFNTEIMAKVLAAIARATVYPKLNIQFSVKNKAAVSERLLVDATENAKRKAEILVAASGAALGDLVSINYDWGELHLYSQMRYHVAESCMSKSESFAPDIEPEDIDVQDSVSFVWEIK